MHATYNTLPFTHMPPHLVIEMAKQAIFWLHSFPRVDGVSDHMSPREIMTGQRLDMHDIAGLNMASTSKLTNSMTAP
jgi:hypothetical protein